MGMPEAGQGRVVPDGPRKVHGPCSCRVLFTPAQHHTRSPDRHPSLGVTMLVHTACAWLVAPGEQMGAGGRPREESAVRLQLFSGILCAHNAHKPLSIPSKHEQYCSVCTCASLQEHTRDTQSGTILRCPNSRPNSHRTCLCA